MACNSGHVRRLIWPQGLTWLVTVSSLYRPFLLGLGLIFSIRLLIVANYQVICPKAVVYYGGSKCILPVYLS